jgi:lipoprotein-releasing system ATP-binding protein
MMQISVMDLVDVERTYESGAGRLNVLRGINLSILPGEVVGLVGPSGSGKSTLLHLAGLLERPDAGQITFDGKSCNGLSDRERTRIRREKLGFVYQFHHLLPEFSALDNAALPQLIAGIAPHVARTRASQVLSGLGLAERLTHQPSQLSGGEQQRVAIARALANSPRLLIADEPTGNLDPKTSEAVFKVLFDQAKQQGSAVLVATHNHELIRHMDRVLTLHEGNVAPYSD